MPEKITVPLVGYCGQHLFNCKIGPYLLFIVILVTFYLFLGEEGNSECCDNLISEPSARRSDAKTAREINGYLNKYITVKNITIVAAILVIVLIIVIISLAVRKEKSCPICAPCQSFVCPDSWIIYNGKYFYISKEKRSWPMSSNICSSFNASMAVIDTQKELDFCANILRSDHYWFGLSKKDQVWKWSNGTEFKNQFPVGGEGFCAYVHGKGADSTKCSTEKHFLCSLPEGCHKLG
ncbi:C-type lectin domain family 2 member B-like [Erythrolamprus reginae]|uniref:C-type lectin domain family 2 member B-like n=1 Tax=Erythrolamprus reginae TaxID=121349 RepID=UPI00396C9EF4